MNLFLSAFKWVMLVSGLLTCTMFLGLFAPQKSFDSNFGRTLVDPATEVLVRNWSSLIGVSGLMLIYAAFVEKVRKFALVIAGANKLIFIIIVLTVGKEFLSFGVGTAVIADSIMILLYAAYLILDRGPEVR